MATEGPELHEEHSPQALEACTPKHDQNEPPENNAFKQLALLDQFLALLALWVFLATPAGVLQRGKFVGVSIPIGLLHFTMARAVRFRLLM